MRKESTDCLGSTPQKEAEELKMLASNILGSDDLAKQWLAEARPEFDDLSANQLLATDIGRQQVYEALRRLEIDSDVHAACKTGEQTTTLDSRLMH